MATRDVLVTGAAGFLGYHLCESLINEGFRVTGLDNFATGRRGNIELLIKHTQFRFTELDLIYSFSDLPSVDFIFHLASPASPKDYTYLPIETLMVNSLGTYHLLELARTDEARFIFSSTSEVYGNPKEHPQSEEYWGNVNPVGPRSCYDEGKRFAEALCISYKKTYNLAIGIARIFNTYGPGMKKDDGRVIPNFISQALKGEPITIYGDGKQTRSFCYVSDLINGLLLLMNADCPSPINLGNPEEYSISEIAQIIKELTKSSSPIVYSPSSPDDPERRKPDISKAKALLGWEPFVGLEEGLKRTIEYFKGCPL